MKINQILTFKHPDEMYILPVFRLVYEKVGSCRYLSVDFTLWNRTSYITFKIK